jgi:hypothetical protein
MSRMACRVRIRFQKSAVPHGGFEIRQGSWFEFNGDWQRIDSLANRCRWDSAGFMEQVFERLESHATGAMGRPTKGEQDLMGSES